MPDRSTFVTGYAIEHFGISYIMSKALAPTSYATLPT